MGCTGIKRTTGQHPGGMVVIPQDMEVYDFCPVQHPADDQTIGHHHHPLRLPLHPRQRAASWTSWDTMCPPSTSYLEDYTGIPVMDVSMSDPEVMSLFNSPAALGVTEEDLGGVKTGTLSLPELGTNFVRGMLDGIPAHQASPTCCRFPACPTAPTCGWATPRI